MCENLVLKFCENLANVKVVKQVILALISLSNIPTTLTDMHGNSTLYNLLKYYNH